MRLKEFEKNDIAEAAMKVFGKEATLEQVFKT
jgi:hypothetical protein